MLGTIDFKRVPIISEGADLSFAEIINDMMDKGVPILKEIDNGRDKDLHIDHVSKDDDIFPLALRDYLRTLGYTVIEKHPEIEEELKTLLKDLPDSNEDKKDILGRLESMSYLEQSLLLRELSKVDK